MRLRPPALAFPFLAVVAIASHHAMAQRDLPIAKAEAVGMSSRRLESRSRR
jgi:hypothetical protein